MTLIQKLLTENNADNFILCRQSDLKQIEKELQDLQDQIQRLSRYEYLLETFDKYCRWNPLAQGWTLPYMVGVADKDLRDLYFVLQRAVKRVENGP